MIVTRKTSKQIAGGPTNPISKRTKKYIPLRKKVWGVSKSQKMKRMNHTVTKKNKNIVEKLLPVRSVAKGDQMDASIKGLQSLYALYKKAPILSDRAQDSIYNFLMIVNSALREEAARQEAELLVHFSSGTVAAITEGGGIESEEVEKQVKECISFLKKLKTRTEKKVMGSKDRKELEELMGEFNRTLKESVMDNAKIVENIVAGAYTRLPARRNNVEMAVAMEAPSSVKGSPAAKDDLDDLLAAFKGIGL